MKTALQIATLTVLASLMGCSDSSKEARKNEINRIVFATGGCYGRCPVQTIDIDSTLAFRYHGVKYADTTGFYVGTVTQEFWDSLNMKFESINYKQLDSSYEHSVDDLSTEVFIYYGDKVKHIHGQSMSLPDSVMTVYRWLLKSMRHLELKTTTDSLVFPTIIEKPLPIPPMPDNVKPVPSGSGT